MYWLRRTGWIAISLMGGCILVALPASNVGCTEQLDAQQLKLHEEAKDDAKLFGVVMRAYGAAATDMANKKQELQGQLIQEVSKGWTKDHVNSLTGKVEATPDEWVTMLNQRDTAMAQRFASAESWRTMSTGAMSALDDFLVSSEVIYGKDVDVYEAKKKMADVKTKIFQFIITTAATAAGMGGGVAVGNAH